MILKPETLNDLWSMQRILFVNDSVQSHSLRKFKTEDGKAGDMKDVLIKLKVEKVELDKNSQRLRISGKIIEGRPMEYVQLNSYHTLNIKVFDTLQIEKQRWNSYLLSVVKHAIAITKKPRLGIIVMDDEKALPAYLLGFGIEFRSELYSHLSKRITPKEFQELHSKYFDELANIIREMSVETIIIAGPGFTKDELRKYFEDKGIVQKMGKRIVYLSTSNTERSGVYELIRSDDVAVLLDKERIREEFILMEQFLKGLSIGKSKYGLEDVSTLVDSYDAQIVLVNDSMLSDPKVQQLLEQSEKHHIKIEVFNADDEVGKQLNAFKNICCI